MAPGLTTVAQDSVANHHAPKNVFPDGIRTSGQHFPIAEKLRPYTDFPKQISGPTIWTKEDFEQKPELWTHSFTEDEIEEIGAASDRFLEEGIPQTGISKVRQLSSATGSLSEG
jgi:hypothetical protein